MKINFMKSIILVTMLGIYSLSQAQPGPGENGANRRVSTPSGYGGVVGTFSEPRFNNPYSRRQQSNIDHPELYLGVRAHFGQNHPDNLEVDSGLTWIPAVAPSGRANADANMWSAFSRATGFSSENDGRYMSLFVGTRRWVVPREGLGSARISVSIRDSTAEGTFLYMDVINNGVSMPHSRDVGDPTSDAQGTRLASQMLSKRVTAITQSVTRLDGAFLEGASFTSGRVKKIVYDASSGAFRLVGEYADWNTVGGQERGVANKTHYYPWGRIGQDVDANEYTVTVVDPTLPWVINSRTPHSRPLLGASTGSPANVGSLFKEETVDIHMSKPKPIKVRPVKPKTGGS